MDISLTNYNSCAAEQLYSRANEWAEKSGIFWRSEHITVHKFPSGLFHRLILQQIHYRLIIKSHQGNESKFYGQPNPNKIHFGTKNVQIP